MARYQRERTVAWSETDAAGVVHFARLLVWFEEAIHEAMGEAGVAVFTQEGERWRGWPWGEVQGRFEKPLTLGEKVSVEVWIRELGPRQVIWAGRLVRDETEVATGVMTQRRAERSPEGLRGREIAPEESASLQRWAEFS